MKHPDCLGMATQIVPAARQAADSWLRRELSGAAPAWARNSRPSYGARAVLCRFVSPPAAEPGGAWHREHLLFRMAVDCCTVHLYEFSEAAVHHAGGCPPSAGQ